MPHLDAAFLYNPRGAALELAIKQTGSEAAKRAADIAQRAALEGSNAGIIKARACAVRVLCVLES